MRFKSCVFISSYSYKVTFWSDFFTMDEETNLEVLSTIYFVYILYFYMRENYHLQVATLLISALLIVCLTKL